MRLKTPAILAGDFNLHHLWWNAAADPTKICQAQPFVHWLDNHKAQLVVDLETINNEGGTLLRHGLKRTSVIDLTFSLNFRKTHWEKWRFLPPSGSDHEVITFEASLTSFNQPSSSPQGPTLPAAFNHKKADWTTFRRIMQQSADRIHFSQAATASSMDNLAEHLTAAINTAA